MELHQARYFLALCEEKNFTRAAKRCGVAQPSLSNAIRRLERELGGPLFHRNRENCPLTELGRAVWPHLARLDQCARDARSHAAQFSAASQVPVTALEQAPSINPPRIDGSLGFLWEAQNNRRKGYKMRKLNYLIGACAFAGAAVFIWSQHTLVSPRAHTASASLRPPLPAEAATTAAMSPRDMMITYSKPLPAEQWDAF